MKLAPPLPGTESRDDSALQRVRGISASLRAVMTGLIALGALAAVMCVGSGLLLSRSLPPSAPLFYAIGLTMVALILAATAVGGYVAAAAAPHSPTLHAAAVGAS